MFTFRLKTLVLATLAAGGFLYLNIQYREIDYERHIRGSETVVDTFTFRGAYIRARGWPALVEGDFWIKPDSMAEYAAFFVRSTEPGYNEMEMACFSGAIGFLSNLIVGCYLVGLFACLCEILLFRHLTGNPPKKAMRLLRCCSLGGAFLCTLILSFMLAHACSHYPIQEAPDQLWGKGHWTEPVAMAVVPFLFGLTIYKMGKRVLGV